jgi:hypothetical protein
MPPHLPLNKMAKLVWWLLMLDGLLFLTPIAYLLSGAKYV